MSFAVAVPFYPFWGKRARGNAGAGGFPVLSLRQSLPGGLYVDTWQ
jgi:hypothetical protein